MWLQLLNSFIGGAGFMLGLLIIYTIYDWVYDRVETYHAKKRAAQSGRRRRRR